MKDIKTLDDVIDVLRKIKYKATMPTERKFLPNFMQDWTTDKIASYYAKQKEDIKAINLSIIYLKNLKIIEQTSRDLVALFNQIASEIKIEEGPK
ncbi:MAG: hypothetical protein IJU58_03835 [Clostridia bacterium]|nr:hypothetical protein [Clostridia bacterium]